MGVTDYGKRFLGYDSGMIIDGRALAEDRKKEILERRQKFGALSLGVVIATTDTVTSSYVGIKKRAAASLNIEVEEYRLSELVTEADIISAIQKASKHDGIILQLPIPKGVDVDVVKNAIPKHLDVDVLSDEAFKEFSEGKFPAVPPVPAAMLYVLKRHTTPIYGSTVVLVGKGRLVGRPAEVLFKRLGAKKIITLIKGDDMAPTKDADILVCGAGVPGLIKPEMIKEGVVILDAGASELGGKVVGDADPACAEKASLFTPVPGGIGPIAVVEIFANLVTLYEKRKT